MLASSRGRPSSPVAARSSLALVGLPDELQDFYDLRYADTPTGEPPPRPAYPYDRFDAVRLGLPQLLPPDARVLELAAGHGDVYRSLRADGVEFGEYVLTEISAPRLRALEQLAEDDPAARALEANAEHVDAAELGGEFDAVLAVALIEHLVDPISALRRIRELVRPGGFVWIDTPNIARATRRVRLLAGRFPSTASRNEGLTTFSGQPAALYDEGHLHYWTFRSLESMLTSLCGYSHVVRLPYAATPFPGGRFGSLLARHATTLVSEVCVAAYR